MNITVVGGGLAGCEAAWQLLKRGFDVTLVEMRPQVSTEIHQSGDLAELVCSNSLGADGQSVGGLLKEELRRFGSLIMAAAQVSALPAGKALAVDRHSFAAFVTERLLAQPGFELCRREVTELPQGPTIIATGPLTRPALSSALQDLLGQQYLYFYDAVAPVVELDSLDHSIVYRRDRYSESPGGDYLNCPMEKEEYLRFYEALISAERAPLHSFEKPKYFEGCMPVEVLASRGRDTLRFGPLRPVGLERPDGSRRPWAVVQLRQDNSDGTLYNLVGFQTNLKWSEQQRVFRLIPGLEHAEFVRWGVMHRNIYVDAPRVLDGFLRPLDRQDLFLAGQLAGVEGYVESTAMGLAAALGMAAHLQDRAQPFWPAETAIGALMERLRDTTTPRFQPTNLNAGIFSPFETRLKDRQEKTLRLIKRAEESMDHFCRSQAL